MFDFYNQNLRILNFTHIDLDGATSAIVINNYFNNVITETINYGKEQEAVDKISKHINDVDAIIFTDFTPVNIKFLQTMGKPILVLDHHESAIQFSNPEHGIFINIKYCGAMLAWKYFGMKKDLSYLKDLVTITNDLDLFTLNDPRSICFNSLYWEMGFKWFVRRFAKGNTSLYPEEKDYICFYKKDYKKVYNELPISDLPHKGAFFVCTKYMSELCADLRKEYDYLIIKNGNALSIRSATDKINLLDVCKIVGKGGGHRKAAGIPIGTDNIKQLVENICYAVEHTLNYGQELPF